MSEQLCLTWSDFPTATWDMLRNLLLQGELADVTLVADDGRMIRTHKFMLKSCSSFFLSLLTSDQPNPIIYLTNIRLKEIQNLLKFMYLGQVFLEEADLNLFMTAAEKLKIKGLSEMTFGQQFGAERKIVGETNYNRVVEQDLALSLTLFEHSEKQRTSNKPQESQDLVSDVRKQSPKTLKNEFFDLIKDETDASCAKTMFPKQASDEKLTEVLTVSNVAKDGLQESTGLQWNRVDSEFAAESLPDYQITSSETYHHCGKCDYKSTKLFNVKKHRAAVHDGVRYPCDKCDYKATETGHLKKHKRTRHGSS